MFSRAHSLCSFVFLFTFYYRLFPSTNNKRQTEKTRRVRDPEEDLHKGPGAGRSSGQQVKCGSYMRILGPDMSSVWLRGSESNTSDMRLWQQWIQVQRSPETHSCWVAAGSKDLLLASLLSLQRKVGLARTRQRLKFQKRNPGRGRGMGDPLGRAARNLRRRLTPKNSYQTQSSGQSWSRTKWDLGLTANVKLGLLSPTSPMTWSVIEPPVILALKEGREWPWKSSRSETVLLSFGVVSN